MVPVSSVSCGVPVTTTVSVNTTWIDMTWSVLYEPLVVLDVTLDTVADVVSLELNWYAVPEIPLNKSPLLFLNYTRSHSNSIG